MLKVKESAIKTMAGAALAAANQDADAAQAPVNSTAIVLLNKKLRAGFGFSGSVQAVKPASAPFPIGKSATKPIAPKISAAPIKSTPAQATAIPAATTAKAATSVLPTAPATVKYQDKATLENDINSILGGLGVKATQPVDTGNQERKDRTERLAEEAKRREEDQKKKLEEQRHARAIKDETPQIATTESEATKQKADELQKKAEAARLAEEKRKREEALRLAEEAKKKAEEERIRQEEEKKRLAEEAKKKAEEAEAKKKEDERLAAQEKLRLEKLRIQEERLKAREDRRRKLAQIEKERREGTGTKTGNNGTTAFEPRTGKMMTMAIGDDLEVCLRTLLSKLRAKQSQFEKELLEFPELRKPLDQKKDILKAKINRINADELSIVEKNEQEIEVKEAAERAKLSENMDEQLKRAIEQKLWAIEDQRKEIERQRWAIEDHINNILAEIEVIDSQIDQKYKNEESLKQEIKKIANQEKLVEFCLEKNKLEEEILKNIEQRDSVSPILDAAEKRKFAAKEKFQELTEKETTIKAELDVIEQREKQETDVAKKRLIEQSRWKANSSLKNTIQTKWEAEEKLKNVSIETQTLQTRINAINEKIDKIQADIAAKETVLEGEGIPIRKMRDAIAKLFQENGLEIDEEMLKDIVQEDETEKPIQSNKLKAEPTIAIKTTEPIAAKPQTQPTKSQTTTGLQSPPDQRAGAATPEQPSSNIPKSQAMPVAPAGATSASIPLSSILKPAAPVAPAAPVPSASTGLAGENASAAPTTDKIPESPALAHPILKNSEPIPNNQPITGKPAVSEAAKIINSEPVKMPAHTVEASETTEPETPKMPATVIRPIDPAGNIKAGSKAETELSYREPIIVEPATNFRQFAQRSFGGLSAAETATATKEPENEFKPVKAKIEESPLPVQEQSADVWQDRWGQIKKNTTPGASSSGAPTTANSIEADIEGVELERPTGNKMMVRILVVLLLLAIVGIALALILRKNESTTPAKNNETETKTDTTAKTNSDKDDSSGTMKNDRQLTTLATISTIPIVTDDLASVPNLILPYTKTTLEETGYHKLVIQNKKNNTYVGLKQFLNIYKINAPSAFYSSVSDDFILFIYANKTKNRIGFATQVTDEQGIKAAMSDWEERIVADTNNFYNLIGRKTQNDPDSLEFKSNTASNGTVYRSLTFAPGSDAYTISYAVYNSKWLIFTTSEEALIKIFDQLPK